MIRAALRLLVLGACALSASAQECECLWRGAFAKSQADADLVVAGTVLESKGNSLDLAVTQVLRGQEFQEEIRIWGDYPGTCRAEVSDFPPESGWIMALQRIDSVPAGGFNPGTPNVSYGRAGDYALSRCGANWLAWHGQLVSGNLVDGGRWQYEDPDMTPVLLELLMDYLQGDISQPALREAAAPQEEVKQLMRDTRSFLRE